MSSVKPSSSRRVVPSSGEPSPSSCVAPSHKRVRVSSGCRGGAGVLDSAQDACAVTASVPALGEDSCVLLTPMPTLHYNSTRLPESDKLDSSDLELTFRVSPAFLLAVEAARAAAAAAASGGSRRVASGGAVDPALLATLVSAELLYFDGSVPQVCVEEEDDDAPWGVRMTMSALPSLAPRCVLHAPSKQLTLTLKRTFPISSGHGGRRFLLAFGLAGEVVLTQPFVVLAKKAKVGVPAKCRLQPELVQVGRARGEAMARLSVAAAAAATAAGVAVGSTPGCAPVPCAPGPVGVVDTVPAPSPSTTTSSFSSTSSSSASCSGASLLGATTVGAKRCRVEDGGAVPQCGAGAAVSEGGEPCLAPLSPGSACPLSSLAPFTPPQGLLCGGGGAAAAELEVFENLWGGPVAPLSPLAPLASVGFGADLDLADFPEWEGMGLALEGAVSPFAL